jgi:hypothetical protein
VLEPEALAGDPIGGGVSLDAQPIFPLSLPAWRFHLTARRKLCEDAS